MTGGYYSVRNWAELQHYKHRDPPWVKLYRKLLGNYAWCGLPDASKGHLIGLWLLAGRNDNKIPADIPWIAQQIGAREPVDIQVLVDAGFIEVSSNSLASCPVSAPLETERETETEKSEAADAADQGETPMARVMGAVRRHLYRGGKPPAGWSDRQDASIAAQMLKRGTPVGELVDAIEGARLAVDNGAFRDWTPPVQPGDKFTLRLLYHTKSGALPTWTVALMALDARWKANEARTPSRPVALGSALGGALAGPRNTK